MTLISNPCPICSVRCMKFGGPPEVSCRGEARRKRMEKEVSERAYPDEEINSPVKFSVSL